mgnify:CR=1 FL=1
MVLVVPGLSQCSMMVCGNHGNIKLYMEHCEIAVVTRITLEVAYYLNTVSMLVCIILSFNVENSMVSNSGKNS